MDIFHKVPVSGADLEDGVGGGANQEVWGTESLRSWSIFKNTQPEF